jgi:hypothetical protein
MRPTATPIGVPGALPLPSLTELQGRRADLDEAEATVRQLFTGGTQGEPWNWIPPIEARSRWNRERAREAFVQTLRDPSWRGFLEAAGDLLELTERLPEEERRRWAPEVYVDATLAKVLQEVLGRGTGLAGDVAEVLIVGIMADGNTRGTKRALERTRERFQVLLRSLDRLARRLQTLDGGTPSAELRAFASWAAFSSRRGDVGERLLALLRLGPAPTPEMEWMIVRTTARALFRDPDFVRWENLSALDTERVCQFIAPSLALLEPRLEALATVERRAEVAVYLWLIEAEGRGGCKPAARLDDATLLQRVGRHRERIGEARRRGWPPGDFVQRMAADIERAQEKMVQQGDPMATALARELQALREQL